MKLAGEVMDVSENRGTPKSSILINRVFHHKPSIFGVPLFLGNTQIPRTSKVTGFASSPFQAFHPPSESRDEDLNFIVWGEHFSTKRKILERFVGVHGLI